MQNKFLFIKKISIVLFFLTSFFYANAANYYWVGGTGTWNDYGNHWATSSGGVIFQTTIPGPNDNVYFDSNSFTAINDTVIASNAVIYCKSMDWSGVSINSVFSGIGKLKIYGSLTLSTNIIWNYWGNLYFMSNSPGNTITTNGKIISCNLISFDGINGEWTLMDSLVIATNVSPSVSHSEILINSGVFNTNNMKVKGIGSVDFTIFQGAVNLGFSEIICIEWEVFENTGVILTAAQSKIKCYSLIGGKLRTYGDVEVHSIHADSCIFNDAIFPGGGSINGMLQLNGANKFRKVISNWNLVLDGNNFFIKLMVQNGNLYSLSNEFDTLTMNGAFQSLEILGNSTLTINNSFYISSNASFPVSLNSSTPGILANLNIPSGNICLDYLYIKDLNVSGGASFYAGDHSIDLGNNTGWIWSSCTPDTSNVWPGDANYDLVADNIDLLYIGLAYGYTGPVRVGATTNWVAQPGIDWLQQFATGYNIKHADCDGNGTINAVDTNAVSLNYGLVHPFKNPTPPLLNNFGTDLYFDIPPTSLTPGAVVDIPIMFGTVANAASDVYGIAFTVNYDPAFIQANTAEITFNNSWCGNAGNTIHLSKDFYNSGMVDMALVKTDHQNETGNGQLATLHFKVASNASGYLNLSFSKILVMDKFEITQPVNAINTFVFTGSEDHITSSHFSVSPNPANDFVFIGNSNHSIKAIQFIDVTGKKYEMPVTNHLNTSKLPSGVYELEMLTDEGIYRKKMLIIH